jgi:hypothetical protein
MLSCSQVAGLEILTLKPCDKVPMLSWASKPAFGIQLFSAGHSQLASWKTKKLMTLKLKVQHFMNLLNEI